MTHAFVGEAAPVVGCERPVMTTDDLVIVSDRLLKLSFARVGLAAPEVSHHVPRILPENLAEICNCQVIITVLEISHAAIEPGTPAKVVGRSKLDHHAPGCDGAGVLALAVESNGATSII